MGNLYYYIIAVSLSIIWSVAYFAFNLGAYIHLLIVMAIVSLIMSLIQDDVRLIRKRENNI